MVERSPIIITQVDHKDTLSIIKDRRIDRTYITVRQMVWYSKGGQKTGLKKRVYGPKCPVRI